MASEKEEAKPEAEQTGKMTDEEVDKMLKELDDIHYDLWKDPQVRKEMMKFAEGCKYRPPKHRSRRYRRQ